MSVAEFVTAALLLAGSLLILSAGIGIVRFADALARAHALAKASTLGICLILLALWVASNDEISRLKIMLVIIFSLITIPLAGHLIALLFYRHQFKK